MLVSETTNFNYDSELESKHQLVYNWFIMQKLQYRIDAHLIYLLAFELIGNAVPFVINPFVMHNLHEFIFVMSRRAHFFFFILLLYTRRILHTYCSAASIEFSIKIVVIQTFLQSACQHCY